MYSDSQLMFMGNLLVIGNGDTDKGKIILHKRTGYKMEYIKRCTRQYGGIVDRDVYTVPVPLLEASTREARKVSNNVLPR